MTAAIFNAPGALAPFLFVQRAQDLSQTRGSRWARDHGGWFPSRHAGAGGLVRVLHFWTSNTPPHPRLPCHDGVACRFRGFLLVGTHQARRTSWSSPTSPTKQTRLLTSGSKAYCRSLRCRTERKRKWPSIQNSTGLAPGLLRLEDSPFGLSIRPQDSVLTPEETNDECT